MKLPTAFFRSAVLALALLTLAACEKVPPRPAPATAPAAEPATTAPAGPAKPAPTAAADGLVPGTDYVDIRDGAPLQPEAGKVEVAEVFGYTCPHCANFEPVLAAWKSRQSPEVKFVAVPAPFGGFWVPYAKAYYAAEELGIAEKSHAAVFKAIHVDKTLPPAPNVATNQQIARFYGGLGADPADFARRMDSAPVEQKLRRADAFITRSGVDGTPTMVVAGKYRVLGKSPEDALRIVDALVARERAAR